MKASFMEMIYLIVISSIMTLSNKLAVAKLLIKNAFTSKGIFAKSM